MIGRLRVDFTTTMRSIGVIVRWLSLTLLAPAAVAVIYDEPLRPFVATLAIGVTLGLGLERIFAGEGRIGLRESVAIAGIGWLVAVAVASIPYLVEGGEISRPVDAYFEAMSGLTSSGGTVMLDIEGHSHAILFWRSLTNWLGGMGIIVLALAVLPQMATGGRGLMESETSGGGGFDKLAPRIRDTARRLWLLYVAFTIACAMLLAIAGYAGLAPGMNIFEAINHAFATLSAGGFSTHARSVEGFGPWAQWIIVVFMLVAAINFGVWWRSFAVHPRAFYRDEETRWFLGILAVGSGIVASELYRRGDFGVTASIRHAVFNVVSLGSTTGFASSDFAKWTPVGYAVLVTVVLIGGCAGSTAGAIKVVRVLLIGRAVRRDVGLTFQPELVRATRISGRPVSEQLVRSALAFALVYLATFAAGTLLLLMDASRTGLVLHVEDAALAVGASLACAGPGLGALGPMGSYAPLSDVSTMGLSVIMWAGRLELIPVLALMTRSYWLR